MGHIRADIGDSTSYCDTRMVLQRQDLAGRVGAYDVKGCPGPPRSDPGEHVVHEPGHRIHIGPVVHIAGEDNWLFAVRIRNLVVEARIEIGCIDTLANAVHFTRGPRRELPEKLSVRFRDEEGSVKAL